MVPGSVEGKYGVDSITVWQVSDTHLSESHGYFQDNWNEFVALVHAQRPDLVVHSGDLSFNGPQAPDDLAYCKDQLDRLAVPWLAIPGNHDVGEPHTASRLGQHVSDERLAAWGAQMGREDFVVDVGGWRLIGINCEVLGSGLDSEVAQWRQLEAALADRDGRPVGVFMHKPLFLTNPTESQGGTKRIANAARDRLLASFESSDVRFVSSGHLHGYAQCEFAGRDYVWCPTTAFVHPSSTEPLGITRRTGYVQWTLHAHSHEHEFVQPPLFFNLDITNWTTTSGTSITLPPRPVSRAVERYVPV
jgi:3',5'-cyclic AMP phosphodiesterase CpdA